MKKSKIAVILSILLKIIFIIGVICLFFLPQLYNIFSGIEIAFEQQTIWYMSAFYLCYLVSLLLILELIRIFDNIYKDSPFKKQTELSLKRIAILFMVLAIVVAVKTIFIPTILSIAVAVITFIASLSFYVLSQIFKVAIEYKQEVDYTV